MDSQEIEKLFSSGDPSLILSMYEGADLDSILVWMRNRPSAQIRLVEVEGDEEVVVIIPTSDSGGDFARRTSSLFRGLHIVLVESRGPLFNYARSVNRGLKRARELGCRWAVVVNDDVTRADPPDVLVQQLTVTTKSMIMASPSSYHTYRVSLVRPSPLFLKGMRLIGKVVGLAPAEVYGYLFPRFKDKFRMKFMVAIDSMLGPMKRLAGEVVDSLWNGGSFFVLNRRIIGDKTLDETFINGYEDVYLSLKMRNDLEMIDYTLEEMRGGSLGFNRVRFTRNFVNEIYLNQVLRLPG